MVYPDVFVVEQEGIRLRRPSASGPHAAPEPSSIIRICTADGSG